MKIKNIILILAFSITNLALSMNQEESEKVLKLMEENKNNYESKNLNSDKKRKRDAESKYVIEFNGNKLDANRIDDFLNTILHYAVLKGPVELVKLIIDKFPRLIYAKNKAGKRAIDFCASEEIRNLIVIRHNEILNLLQKEIFQAVNDMDLIKLEKDSPSSYDLINEYGETPLMYACGLRDASLVVKWLSEETEYPQENFIEKEKKLSEIANFLIKKRANINLQDKSGNTALHHAIYYGYKNIVSLLLASGADINLKNNMDLNALDFASFCQNGLVLNLTDSYEIIEIINIINNYKISLESKKI